MNARLDAAAWLRARADRIWAEFLDSRGGNCGRGTAGQSHRQRDRHLARVRELRDAADELDRLAETPGAPEECG